MFRVAALRGGARRRKAKVIMPQKTESSIPLDDDDILDLTEVATPGKDSIGPLEPGDGPADFGADLDALLDSLAPDGTVSAPAAPSSGTASPENPIAAPIRDQTPVAHTVDPNEEMAMPETSDIDSLLAELGADVSAEPFDPPAAAPVPGFDGLLAKAKEAEAQKAAEEKAAEESARAVAVAAAPKSAALPGSGITAGGSGMDEDDAESFDLNELDALLDDILATAPEMRPATPAEPVAAGTAEPSRPAAPEEEAAGADAALAEDDLPEVIPVPEAALMPNDAPDPSFEARIRRLEDAVEVLETEVNGQLSENMVDALIDAKLAALLAPGSKAVAKIVEDVLARVAAPETENEDAGAFRVKLEKMAAAAAAKVIREEIAAIMSE